MGKIYPAVSLFCGAGGLDIGFERAGIQTCLAIDAEKDAIATYKDWHGTEDCRVICGDVRALSCIDLPYAKVMLGGFPCQGFSLSGPRKERDLRNILYQEYVRIVRCLKPLVFVGENVKGLLSMGNGKVFETILKDFSDCGYTVRHELLNAKDYDVPEDRERVILVGIRKDLDADRFSFPKPSEPPVTLRDALRNLPIPRKEDICDAPYSSRYMSRNRKRGWDEQSFTIPAMAKQVPLHPSSPDMVKLDADHWAFGEGITRRLSWQEAAAIQIFPNGMRFYGDLKSIYRQIGNAVPVKLAEHIAIQVKTFLDEQS